MAVLNWGLGHATRTISIIHRLREMDCEVVIASSGVAGDLLKQEFPECVHHSLPDYNVDYRGGFMLAVFRQAFKLFRVIRREHFAIRKIAAQERPQLIISDNRYGCYHPEIPSVFICHQPNIPISFLRPLAVWFHSRFLKRFKEIWIPDMPDQALSGDLSNDVAGVSTRFIGPLSRFEWISERSPTDEWFAMGIVSGPEPDRIRFEQKLLKAMISTGKSCLLVTGVPSREISYEGLVKIAGHLPAVEFLQAMRSSKVVISRSGYSSILDYAVTGVRAILVPTPGQPEQEYLAGRAENRGHAVRQDERNIQLEAGFSALAGIRGFPKNASGSLLTEAIRHSLRIKPS